MITIHCDGGARGNPGPAAYGFVVKEEGIVTKKGRGYLGIATNNFAEYTAVTEALKWLQKNRRGKDLEFYLDSNLVVSQLSGIYKVRNSTIRNSVFEIRALENNFGQIKYHHIPREQNKEADRLVNQALDEQNNNLR